MPSKQETFDQICRGLIEQGEPSISMNGECRYRLIKDDGTLLKCGAGQVVPDDSYDPRMEGGVVAFYEHDDPGQAALGTTTAGKIIKELGHDVALVKTLQAVHDTIARNYMTNRSKVKERWLPEFIARARAVGINEELDVSVLGPAP